jgi:hypothetical protein
LSFFFDIYKRCKFINLRSLSHIVLKFSVSLCCWVGQVVYGLLLKTNEHGGGELSGQAIWTLQTKLFLFIKLCCICTFSLESRCYNRPPTQFPIPLAFFILLVYSLVTRLPMRCQEVGYVKDNMFREGRMALFNLCPGHCSYISQLQNPCFHVPPITKINSFLCSIFIASTRLTNRTSQSTIQRSIARSSSWNQAEFTSTAFMPSLSQKYN